MFTLRVVESNGSYTEYCIGFWYEVLHEVESPAPFKECMEVTIFEDKPYSEEDVFAFVAFADGSVSLVESLDIRRGQTAYVLLGGTTVNTLRTPLGRG